VVFGANDHANRPAIRLGREFVRVCDSRCHEP
jgi:hypothetical protein